MESPFGTMVSDALLSLLAMVLTWALASARNELKKKVDNEYLQGLLLRLTDVVESSVREAAQVSVPLIREAAKDGKLTSKEAATIKEAVRISALDQLVNVDRAKLEEFFDERALERKLDTLIEAAVQKMKEKR